MFGDRDVKIGRLTTVVSMSLVLFLAVGCSRDPNVRKQKYLESGKKYEAGAKYKEAIIQFGNALKVDKNFGDAHYELAKTYLKMGNVRPASEELMRTVNVSPSNQAARIDLGNMLLAGRLPDRAQEQANAVLGFNPNNADAHALLAGVAQYKGDNAEAMKDIQRALAIDPNRSSFHTASALLQSRDPASEGSAEAELRKATELDAKVATPHLLLAALLEKKGDVQGAEQQDLAAIGAEPTNLQARISLAGLYFRAGDKGKVETTLHKAVEDLSDNEEAAGILAQFYGRTGQLDHAVTVFSDLNTRYPKSFAIKITYARLLADKKDFAKATTVANELTKSEGANSEVQVLNALLLLNSGKTNDAFTLLQKATKDTPNNLQTQLLLARVAGMKGDMGAAETAFRAAAKLSPTNLDAQNGLAEIAMRRNDNGMLTEIADKTIQLHPDFAQGYLWRGTAEGNRKEFDKAAIDFQTVIDKNPNDAAAYQELGQLKLAQGHVPEGKAMLEKAVDKDPNSLRALAMLVAYDLEGKQPAKAVSRIEATISKSPGNGQLYEELALVQMRTSDFKGALESSKKAMQLNPSSSGALQIYTAAEVALGDTDSAIDVWQKWLATHPSDANATNMLGSFAETKGDQPKAMEYYKKSLQLDPNNALASNNLAYLMVDNGQNIDVALSLAQTARRAMPKSPQAADTLAWIYYQKQNYTSARDLLEEALKTSPEDASIHFHLGMTYSKLNHKPEAQLHLKKAASIAPNSKLGMTAAAELAKLG